MKSYAIAALLSAASAKTIVGTNIGGWMVLEPWITPSLFYRFLGKTKSQGVGMDSWTFCEALGPEEGNKVMREHWDEWFKESDIADLAKRGVEMVRLPIGDWTLEPYGPYVGCMDGSEEKIQWFYDTAHKYGIKVWLDVHAIKDSQNGFDNSGQAKDLQWKDETHFKHWSIQTANWLGDWDVNTKKYTKVRWDHVDRSVRISENLIKRWHKHPAFTGFQPVNEPWWNSNINVLKTFYRRVRNVLRKYKPDATFIFHNAFIFEPSVWNDIFPANDLKNVVMDHHFYQAWNKGDMRTPKAFCDDYEKNMAKARQFKFPVWIGEWSLATDVCAHWLGGFNDANTKPQFNCRYVDCPKTYMKNYGTDFDRNHPSLGPYGEFNPDYVTIQYGKCSSDSDFFNKEQVR